MMARRVSHLDGAGTEALLGALRTREAAFRRASRARPLDYDVLFERHNASTRPCATRAPAP